MRGFLKCVCFLPIVALLSIGTICGFIYGAFMAGVDLGLELLDFVCEEEEKQ